MTNIITRPVFKSSALIKMKDSLKEKGGYTKYLESEYKILQDDTVRSSSKVPKREVVIMNIDKAYKKGDGDSFDAAVQLFEAYSALTPEEASDERFWAYLTHADFFSYMKKRTNLMGVKEEKRAKYILDHWFVDSVNPASLMNNDLARLWWVVFLTKNDKLKDPYYYTREVFSMLDYTTHLIPGTQGRNVVVRTEVLKFIISNKDLFSKYKEKKVRFIMRQINIKGGYTALSCLQPEQIAFYLDSLVPQIKIIKDA